MFKVADQNQERVDDSEHVQLSLNVIYQNTAESKKLFYFTIILSGQHWNYSIFLYRNYVI